MCVGKLPFDHVCITSFINAVVEPTKQPQLQHIPVNNLLQGETLFIVAEALDCVGWLPSSLSTQPYLLLTDAPTIRSWAAF